MILDINKKTKIFVIDNCFHMDFSEILISFERISIQKEDNSNLRNIKLFMTDKDDLSIQVASFRARIKQSIVDEIFKHCKKEVF